MSPRTHLIAGLLLLGHVSLGITVNLGTPIFEAPDEPNHYLFVRYLQIHRALPVQTLDRDGPRAHHPPLYHLLGALISAWVPDAGSAERINMRINPKVWFRYDDPDMTNKAMWVHYGPDERWPYHGQALAVHVLRLLSLAFSASAVWLTYQAARQLRPGDGRLAVLAAGLLGFNPMVLFMSGVVQNNTTLLASGAAIVYALSVFIRRGWTPLRWALLGAMLGLGVLLQLGALVLALPIGLALALECWRSRRLRSLLMGGLAVLLPAALLTGWWFLRNRALYGDWTGNSVVAAMWCCDPISPGLALTLMLTGLLGRFGQGLMITYPSGVYAAAGLLAVIALAGLAWSAARQMRARGPRDAAARPDLLIWSVHAVTALGVSAALLFWAVTVAPGVPGRYMFPAFPSLAILLAAGCLAWAGPRLGGWAAGGVIALTLGAALYGLFGLLIPTYAMPRSPSQAELRELVPLEANIGGVARLLGYRLSADSVKAGQDLVVTAYWLPEAATDRPYTVFVHLYDPALGSLAQRDTYPGGGNYATLVWDPGRPFVDSYRLSVPPNTPATASARIVLGLYDGETMQRLGVTGRDAGQESESWVQFGEIRVLP